MITIQTGRLSIGRVIKADLELFRRLPDIPEVLGWNVVRIDDYLQNENLHGVAGWTRAVYLGWTPPEVFLKGSRSRQY